MATTVRADALSWLTSKCGVKSNSVYTSKFYIPKKSWTKRSAWWLEIPRSIVEKPKESSIHLVCQQAPSLKKFHCLKVPVVFFKKELRNLCVRVRKKGKVGLVSLWLSAESDEMFVDLRGGGRVSFKCYLMTCKANGRTQGLSDL